MRRITLLLVSVAALAGIIAYHIAPAFGQADKNSPPIFLSKMPSEYRDWKWISSAHEEGNLNSLGAVLGNDTAIKAYRDGKLPFPDGTILAALHFSAVPSDENNKIFGKVQSIVPGPPTNIQFMIKDSKKYAATGGWGYGHFSPDGKPGADTLLKTCAPCHAMASRDHVFTRYAP